MKPSTHLIHHPYTAPSEFEAPQIGVFKASTVIFPNMAAVRSRQWLDKSAYTYGLHGTPTTFTLEERLASLEGGKHCILTPSGLAAIAHVDLTFLRTGDEVLIPDNAYAPNKSLAEGELVQFGVTHQYYDAMNPADLASRITEKTRLIWLEAAGSVTMEFPDLIALVRICKENKVLCVLDNTWGAGLAFNPFDLLRDGSSTPLGVDMTIHALTKYPSGGGDVLMGSIVTQRDDLARKLKLTHMRLGTGVGGNDAEAVLRALPSLSLRYKAQDQAARALAQWCSQQTMFTQVLHPAMPLAPGHQHWKAICVHDNEHQGLAAGIFSVVVDEQVSQAQIDQFCDSLKLFKIGYSWGGPMSLVMPYQLKESRSLAVSHCAKARVIRFCIGLEQVDDLILDLKQALQRVT